MHALLAVVLSAAPLIVEGEPVYEFRTTLNGFSPEERLSKAQHRLSDLTEGELGLPVRLERVEAGDMQLVSVFVGERFAFSVLRSDFDAGLDDLAFEAKTQDIARALGRGLHARAEREYPHVLWRDVAEAAGATLVFALLLWLLTMLGGLVGRQLTKSSRLRDAGTIGTLLRRSAMRVLSVLLWAVGALLAYLWVAFVLTRFGPTRLWGETLGSQLLGVVKQWVLAFVAALPGLVAVGAVVLVTRFLTRMVHALADAIASGRFRISGLYPETLEATRRVVTSALWLAALVIAWPYIPGSGTDAFKGLSVLVGVMLSLGSTGVVNQLLSGLVVVYTRALSAGDWVRVGDVEGEVKELGVLSVKILTPNHREVTVPNAVVTSSAIHNFTRAGGGSTVVSVVVTLGYDLPWRRIHELMQQACTRVEALKSDPLIRQRALQNFAVEYELVAQVTAGKPVAAAHSALHAAMQDVFNEAKMEILTPDVLQLRQGVPPSV